MTGLYNSTTETFEITEMYNSNGTPISVDQDLSSLASINTNDLLVRGRLGEASFLMRADDEWAFSYHMLTRYATRQISEYQRRNMSGIDILKSFLSRNKVRTYLCYCKDQDCEVYDVYDGLVFGSWIGNLFLVKSFINNSSLSDEQRDARMLVSMGNYIAAERVYNSHISIKRA